MIRAHAVYTRSFGVREILIQTVKPVTWPSAVQFCVLNKSYQTEIVSEKAKFTLVVECRLQACYLSSSNLSMPGKNISTVKYTQHFIPHCSIYGSWINSLKCRVQFEDSFNKFTPNYRPWARLQERKIFNCSDPRWLTLWMKCTGFDFNNTSLAPER